MDDQTIRAIVVAASYGVIGATFPIAKKHLFALCDRIDERIARRRGEWDDELGKPIPYWDREPGARRQDGLRKALPGAGVGKRAEADTSKRSKG
ncbi:hypothetical protein B1M_03352 [Burkholderia sp. TJI49]|nr:hypothetical protein B1M_03352 [Burkholderia sp. TJI49]